MDQVVSAFESLSTATVSDALDRLGIAGQALGIMPLADSFAMCGRAFTCRVVPAASATGSMGDYIDDLAPGTVVVLDNAGRMDGTVWGDLLTIMASRKKLAGTVIHGVCRDARSSKDLHYPVFSRGRCMRTGRGRVQADKFNEPVSLGDVRVEPGDIILGDADGVVCIPRGREAEVLAIANEIEAAEERIRTAIQGGLRLDEARQQNRYFELQAKVK